MENIQIGPEVPQVPRWHVGGLWVRSAELPGHEAVAVAVAACSESSSQLSWGTLQQSTIAVACRHKLNKLTFKYGIDV